MKRMKFYQAVLIILPSIYYMSPSVGEELEPVWLTSACYQLRLAVWDKLMVKGNYVAKYTIRADGGRVFVAEKNVTGSNSSEVIFPDDFHDAATNLRAWVDCRYGQSYTWTIYADDVLKDTGTIDFSRKKRK